jgi:hypothetical protein
MNLCVSLLLILCPPALLPSPAIHDSLSLGLFALSPGFCPLVPGPRTYLKTPAGGRATPEAVRVPQGTSSSSSSSSRSRRLLDT